ncbi:hypothetical protein [Sodalinema gerasimenkoae]|uniref:hypothetical protein n=1 Tax=Sodalinema gerasimenkoae TaxID=2862348 RepID=UPI00135CAD14|nr:hypothetical protein [Sodalinema gerasimenkoae]
MPLINQPTSNISIGDISASPYWDYSTTFSTTLAISVELTSPADEQRIGVHSYGGETEDVKPCIAGCRTITGGNPQWQLEDWTNSGYGHTSYWDVSGAYEAMDLMYFEIALLRVRNNYGILNEQAQLILGDYQPASTSLAEPYPEESLPLHSYSLQFHPRPTSNDSQSQQPACFRLGANGTYSSNSPYVPTRPLFLKDGTPTDWKVGGITLNFGDYATGSSNIYKLVYNVTFAQYVMP